ncbi:penicillin-binding protein 2B [Streptococcus loxodontisalivarius]|uniref:Penicillin-binding protein 2B n=2 Tax=Streptococcus loxodontisalivarius TaxID=1349415 RepID=A0ABS2PTI0_9STRE|nr:penicillin-binding protein 2B [Streptococcus loxodontisalivarius]
MFKRFYLLFGIIILLFLALIGRLAYMQLYQKSFYSSKLGGSSTYSVSTGSERGEIYDADGVALVENNITEAVAFTRSNTITSQEIKELAQKLSQMITLSDTDVTTREKKDYYLADTDTYREVVEKLPNKKKYDNYGNSLSESTIYSNAVEAVTDDQINFSDDELKIVHIFSQMNATSVFNTTTLDSEDLTDDQIALVTANQSKLSGISVTKAWNRSVNDTGLSSIIGTVSSSDAGLPEEDASTYLAKGYSLNDRVGTSYLEKSYEDVLQGTRTKQEITVDADGNVTENKTTSVGEKGKNIKLTIDLDFQNQVESILQSYYSAQISSGIAAYSEGIYAVALDPSTGSVLAMAGLSHETGSSETESNALGTITQVFTPGSVVKGATLASGWENKVLSGNEVLYDQTLLGISSWFTSGKTAITATQALEYSSNTYMVQVALKMTGQEYTTADAVTTDNYKQAMEELRSTYAEFGMGTSTGLDITESDGYLPSDYNFSNMISESFGQYDNYTTMQLAQYAATVANDGKRQSVHLVEGVYDNNDDGGLGDLSQKIESQTLNTVNISSDEMDLIQTGFYNVVNSSSGYATGTAMRGTYTTISGKTGTAETFATDSDGNTVATVNLNVVAYDANRSIAVAVMYPHANNDDSKAHQYIARDIIDLYVSTYANSSADTDDSDTDN